MNDIEVLDIAKDLVRAAGITFSDRLSVFNFQVFYDTVQDVVSDMPAEKRSSLSIEWATRLHKLVDDFQERVRLDPLLLYVPRTSKHLEFHEDPSFIRHLPGANGIGKSLLEYIEGVWQATGQKHFKEPGNVALLATGHSVYSVDVFQRKYLEGEDSDALSPYTPENGFWFHSYDRRAFTIRLACQACADKRKPKQCTHISSIKCLSADSGMHRLMGFTARLGISDELTPEDTWNELVQRVIRVRGRMIVGATPLGGLEHWTTKLMDQAKNREFKGIVGGHNISKLDCIGSVNGPTWRQIQLERQTLAKTSFAVRVLGQVTALGDSIFNLALLDQIDKAECRDGLPGRLTSQKPIEEVDSYRDVSFELNPDGNLQIWEKPSRQHSYCMGSDVATGIRQEGTDASCTYVFKVTENAATKKHNLEMVAKLYGRLDTYTYAQQVKLLGMWYGEALVIPEVNAIGAAFLTDLKRHMDYANIFTEETGAEYVEDGGIEPKLGITSSESSKPAMVAALAWYLNNRYMIIRDRAFLGECRTFQRVVKTNIQGNQVVRYGAAPGAHDDMVTACALAAFACSSYPDQVDAALIQPEPEEESGPPPPRKEPYDPFLLLKGKKGKFKP